MFEPDFLVFCESKAVGSSGNLSLHEIFERVYFQEFPSAHRPFKLVFRLIANSAVVNKTLKLKVELALKNKEIAKIEAELHGLTIEKGNGFVPDIDISNFVFPSPGEYTIKIWVNDKLFFERPLIVGSVTELSES